MLLAEDSGINKKKNMITVHYANIIIITWGGRAIYSNNDTVQQEILALPER